MMNFGLWIKKRSNMSRIKIVIIIAVIAFFCLQLDAQDNKISKSTGVFESGQSSITIVNVDISSDVPVYEYVPKVIIKGKWGSNPGEFGVWETMNEGDRIVYEPTSMAVDSKGNIYILDIVNERIQKFDSEGRYLLSIPVESFSGKRYEVETMVMVDKNNPDVKVGPSDPNRIDIKKKVIAVEPDYKVIGKNIVIDSEDRLYYYLERNEYERYEAGYKEEEKYEKFIRRSDYDYNYVVYYSTYMVGYRLKKKTGEVWEFKDDKLVRKWEVPVNGNLYYQGPQGIILSEDNSIWIPNIIEDGKRTDIYYEVRSGKRYTRDEFEERMSNLRKKREDKNRKYKVDIKKEERKAIIEVMSKDSKKLSDIVINSSEIYDKAKNKYGKAYFNVYFLGENENGNILVKVREGFGDDLRIEEREYRPDGKLVKLIKISNVGTDIESGLDGIKIKKWILKRVR
jgi:hypothetical protein